MTFRTALETLSTYLKTQIETDSDFSPFGGASVFLLTDRYTEEEQVGKPHIVLSGTDERAPRWGRFAYRATIAAPCKASRSAGGLMGTANPDPAHVKLSRKLEQIIVDNHNALENLGLLDATVKVGNESFAEKTDVAAVAVTITFVFFMKED